MSTFTLHNAHAAIEHATRSEHRLAAEAEGYSDRLRHGSRAAAFDEALEIIEAIDAEAESEESR